MQLLINVNDSVDSVAIPISTKNADITLTGHVIWGIILIIIAAYLRRLSVSDWKKWEKASEVIEPSLQASPPPIITTRQGCFGLITSGLTGSLFWILMLMAVDQLINNGDAFVTVFAVLQTW